MEDGDVLQKVTIESEFPKPKQSTNYRSIFVYVLVAIVLLVVLCLKIYNKKANENNLSHYDYIIVGSGLYGSTFNYLAKKQGKKTLIIEKSNVTGGSLYCQKIEGISVHKYGPHIFHTDNKTLWDFVNSLVEFTPYITQSIAKIKDKIYSLPNNMWTFNQLWDSINQEQAFAKIEEQRYKGEIHNLEDKALSLLGKDIYEKIIKGYLKKMWDNNECPNLPPFIMPNIQKNYIYDNNFFFQDRYQGIPVGCYNSLFNVLLNDTEIDLSTDFIKNKERYLAAADKIVFTGKIDEYYDYIYGPLEYKTLRWENKIKNVDNFQGSAIIYYPDLSLNYTRVIEHKHFEPYNRQIQGKRKTIVSYEYPEKWDKEKDCLYPINDEKNNNLYLKYKELADKEKNIIFGGRLATYKYYEMADIIEQVFRQFNM